jgi:serine/threonine-protein kinase
LLVISAIGALGTGVHLLRGAPIGTGSAPLVPFSLLAILGISAGLLLSRVALSLARLRVLELTIFGAVAAYLANESYLRILNDMQQGSPRLALSSWTTSALHFVVLMVIYGIFIPNARSRASLVVAGIGAIPMGLGALLWLRHPGFSDSAASVTTAGTIADVILPLIMGMAIAIFSVVLINAYRRAAVDAQDLGVYDLKGKIGSGGMGEVWLGEHKILARPAAVKLIRRDTLGNGDDEMARRALRRFELEAQATATLRSPHTVELYDFGVTSGGVFYYVMEYLEGLDLDTLVRRSGPVPAERAIHFMTQACDSLGDAHAKGMVHRDIKPANIFSCRMGLRYDYVKVLDFGLVKASVEENGESRITREGSMTGTPAYMSPEMALEEDMVDARSDIYALGCVCYWLLTGKELFEAKTAVGVLTEHIKTAPIPPKERGEMEIPEELNGIVLKCLEKDPADRFQSVLELSTALTSCPVQATWDSHRAERWWKLHNPDARVGESSDHPARNEAT